MGLLKEVENKPKTPIAHPIMVTRWPKERESEGVGISVKDGWNFGVGLGLALTIAVPIILGAIGCLFYTAVVILGLSLGN